MKKLFIALFVAALTVAGSTFALAQSSPAPLVTPLPVPPTPAPFLTPFTPPSSLPPTGPLATP